MKPYSLMFASFAAGCTFSLLALAGDGDRTDPYAQQRERYQQAAQALEAGDLSTYETLKKGLRHYPLYPYLMYDELDRDLPHVNQKQISGFLHHYGQTPLASRLQRHWLDELSRRQDWHGLLAAYRQLKTGDTRYACIAHVAQLHTGQRKEAYAGARTLWDVGTSQPDSCDPLFDSWIKAGGLTSDIAYSRFWKAVDNGNPSLARYTERYITDPAQKKVTALFWQVEKNPSKLADRTLLLPADHSAYGQIALYGLRRLARQDLDQTVELWLRDRDRLAIDPQARARFDRYLGLRLAKNFAPNLEPRLSRLDPKFTHPILTEWRIRNALAALDWARVLDLIEKLPAKDREEGRWLYWRQVADEATGAKPSKAQASAINRLTGERSFYGFLCAEMNDRPYALNDHPATFDRALIKRLEQRPAFERMHELLYLHQEYPARSEWNQAQSGLTELERHAAAHIAARWGWHDQAIRGAISAHRWNDLAIRFPHPYRSLFERYAEQRGINRTWALSIARQESAFQAGVQSRVGARGLMQLMPRTASRVAHRYDVPYRSVNDLYAPQTNIALGTAYLSQMLDKFDGNRVFATAAYNAGPKRVSQWLEQRGNLPLDIWIETIPFDETRNYVQNVLAFGVIYDVRADRPTRMLSPAESSQLALNQLDTNGDRKL